ncbi:hypothetical protein ACIFOT_26910 [Neobacillus sp. NRS-1170]|uniref:hypothetical protein n=1 Tax=Neobacillus sp. NRS-1170 TaxID=3233898 RepID=UPI003D27E5A4
MGVITFIKYSLMMLPTLLTLILLIRFFPNTGLGRIVAFPTIFIINSVLFILGFKMTRNLKFTANTMIWIAIILLTVVITMVFYPQEYGPHIIKKIIEKIKN